MWTRRRRVSKKAKNFVDVLNGSPRRKEGRKALLSRTKQFRSEVVEEEEEETSPTTTATMMLLPYQMRYYC